MSQVARFSEALGVALEAQRDQMAALAFKTEDEANAERCKASALTLESARVMALRLAEEWDRR